MVFNSDLIRSKEAKQVNESSFTFLERSSWNRCRMVREIVEGWVSRMKPDAEFLSKLRGKNDKQHAAAMFELIVYALLTKTGYPVQIHPPVQRQLLRTSWPS